MHNIGSVQPHTTVETYGVHHILHSNLSFMESNIATDIEKIVADVTAMVYQSEEQNQYLNDVLQQFYHNRNKYEMIHLIRRFTQQRIMITYKCVPFFKIVVRDFYKIVLEARCIYPIKVIKH